MVNFDEERKSKQEGTSSTPKIPALNLDKLNKQVHLGGPEGNSTSQRSIFERNSF